MIREYLDSILALGVQYGVNPLIFTIIYFAGIPVFFVVLAWLAKRAKQKKPILVQILLLGYLLIQPYLYVVIFGRGVPWWVYLVIVVLVLGGAWSLRGKILAAKNAAK